MAHAGESPFLGQRVDRYELHGLLGRGGMGVVYAARDTSTGVEVALKTLDPALLGDANARARLEREVRVMSALSHPFVARVRRWLEHEGQPFIVAEYVEGKTLDDFVRDNEPPLRRRLELAIEITDALAAIHRAGIVHRDLKPSNVMVDTSEHARVMDFGIAALVPGSGAPADELGAEAATRPGGGKLTRLGASPGSPAFMAPEQRAGAGADEKSDLYALGLLLGVLFTGRHPLIGDARGGEALRERLARGRVDPALGGSLRALPGLARLVERLLARAPSARPASAEAVLDELLHMRERLEARRSRRGVLAALGLVLALVVLAAFAAATLERAPDAARGLYEAPAPDDASGAALARALALGDEERYADALAVLEGLVREHEGWLPARALYAELLFASGRERDAREQARVLRVALGGDDDAELSATLSAEAEGIAARILGETEAAVGAFRRVVESESEGARPRVQARLAEALRELGREEAAEVARGVLASESAEPATLLRALRALIDLGHLDESEEALAALRERFAALRFDAAGPSLDALAAQLAFRRGDVEGALALFEGAVLAFDEAGQRARALGAQKAALDMRLRLASNEELDEVLEGYGRVLEGARAEGHFNLEARTLGSLGSLHLRAGRTGEALDLIERALSEAEKLGNERLLAQPLIVGANAALATAQTRRGHELARAALDVCTRYRRVALLPYARMVLAESSWALGEVDEARALYDALFAEPFDEESAYWWSSSALWGIEFFLSLGELERAHEVALLFAEGAESTKDERVDLALALRALTSARLGRLDEAQGALARLPRGSAEEEGAARSAREMALAAIAFEEGRYGAVVDNAPRGAEPDEYLAAARLVLACEAALALGDEEVIEEMLALIEDREQVAPTWKNHVASLRAGREGK